MSYGDFYFIRISWIEDKLRLHFYLRSYNKQL